MEKNSRITFIAEMRLRYYISEQLHTPRDWEELQEVVNKECSEILKIYKRTHQALYRGVRKLGLYQGIATVKQGYLENRKPKDTPQWAHNYMNKELKKRFGWPVRNGISTTTDPDQAKSYGSLFTIFPQDGFKFAYIEGVSDLFTSIDNMLERRSRQAFDMGQPDWFPHEWTNFHMIKNPPIPVYEVLDHFIKLYSNKLLENAFREDTEVMIFSKYYYLISVKDHWHLTT